MARDREAPSSERRQVLEREIAGLRGELTVAVHEVERRLRQAVDVRRQARRHPMTIAAMILAVAGALGVAYAVSVRRRHHQATRRQRAHNLRLVVRHLMRHPEDVLQRHPSTRDKLLGAGKAAGLFGAKRVARRALHL